ncbi:MAG TPA: PIN domain-containing protein [Pyrinomonadaceae bacterium]|jgi:predicted nucleic acid-binding protein|nr:PIN domain-containing protein [Pyrinomonadaceae bacterium]
MLLDTSGLMCVFDRRERRHGEAVKLYNSASRRFSHNYVLAEFVALTVARRAPKELALKFVEALLESTQVDVMWVDEATHRASVALLQARLDKEWSLCDAASFVLMQRQGETEAFTTDHHFEQAGFVRLLSS